MRPGRLPCHQIPNGVGANTRVCELHGKLVQAFACNAVERGLNADNHRTSEKCRPPRRKCSG